MIRASLFARRAVMRRSCTLVLPMVVMLIVILSPKSVSAQVEPFIGEIRWVGFNFAPQGWALCNGQLLAISQNTALYSLLGTQYGGDGRVTFNENKAVF